MLHESKVYTVLTKPKVYFGVPQYYGALTLFIAVIPLAMGDTAFVKFVISPLIFFSMYVYGRYRTPQDPMWFDVIITRVVNLKETLFGGRYNA
jgi:type IV secretory pathway VirB3-like protein